MFRILFFFLFYFSFNNYSFSNSDIPIIYITPQGFEKKFETKNIQNQFIDLKDRLNINLNNKQKIFDFSNQIDVDLSNGDYGHQDININGGDPNFTIIALDGLQLNNHANSRGGSFNLRDLSFKNIDQINFLSGTNAQILGSGSMSGFLNLNLGNSYFEDEQNFDFEKSSISESLFYEKKKNYNSFSGKNKISYLKKDDDKTNENLKNINLLNKIYFKNKEILFGGLFTDATFFPDDSGGNLFSTDRALQDEKTDNLFLSLKINKILSKNVKNFNQFDFFYSKEDINKPLIEAGARSADPKTISNTFFKNSKIKNYYVMNINDYLKINSGFEFNYENAIDESQYIGLGYTKYEDERNSFKLYNSLDFVLFENAKLNFSGTLNKSESYNNKQNYSVSIELNNKIGKFNFSQGTGFKIPSFYALNNGLVGDKSLVPETNLTRSISFNKELNDKNTINLLINKSEYKNLINYSNTKFKMVNEDFVVSTQYLLSIESIFNDNFSLKNSVNFLDTNIKNSSDELRKRPDYKFISRLKYMKNKNEIFNLILNSVGKSFDSSIPTGNDHLDSYNIVDVLYKKKINKNNNLQISIENIFNKDYQKSIGFNNNHRTINVSFKMNF